MDFKARLQSGAPILMEGALGERLKREYGLSIDGAVAMASLVYDAGGARPSRSSGDSMPPSPGRTICRCWSRRPPAAPTGRAWRSPRGTRPSSATTCDSCAAYSGKTARICTWVG